MTKKLTTFSEQFAKQLGKLVGKEKTKAQIQKITMNEFDAIITTMFQLLGQNAELFKKKAGLK